MAASNTLFTRIDLDLKEALEQFVSNPPDALLARLKGKKLIERLVVEQALRYVLFTMPQDSRYALLSEGNNPLALFGDVLEDMTWCEHAFRKEFWNWAFTAYKKLGENFRQVGGIQKIANYYKAYSLMGMHDDLKSDAIEILLQWLDDEFQGNPVADWEGNLYEADHALWLAIHYSEEYRSKGGDYQVVPYNMACSFSLRCELLVVKSLTHQVLNARPSRAKASRPNAAAFDELKAHLVDVTSALARRSAATPDDIWSRFSDSDFVDKKLKDELVEYANSALEHLKLIDEVKGSDSLANANFLVRLADEDRDLAFVRRFASSRKAFKEWVDGHERKTRLDDFREMVKDLGDGYPPKGRQGKATRPRQS